MAAKEAYVRAVLERAAGAVVATIIEATDG